MRGAANQTYGLPPLGAVIREARLHAGLTLAQLGSRVGYSAATISRLERGKQQLRDIVVLRTMADALGITPATVGLADPPHAQGTASHRTVHVQVVTADTTPRQVRNDHQLAEGHASSF